MENCQFCLDNKILKGKILAQNEYVYFVESIDPILQHAGMIIPFRHIETPFEFNQDEWIAVFSLLKKTKNILEKDNPAGFTIGWNVGEDAGQNIPHVHLHVIARFSDEPLVGKGLRYAFKQKSNQRPKH